MQATNYIAGGIYLVYYSNRRVIKLDNYVVTNKKTGEVFYFKTIYQICDLTGLTRSQVNFRIKKDYDETWKIEYIREKEEISRLLSYPAEFRKKFTKDWLDMQKLFGIKGDVE